MDNKDDNYNYNESCGCGACGYFVCDDCMKEKKEDFAFVKCLSCYRYCFLLVVCNAHVVSF